MFAIQIMVALAEAVTAICSASFSCRAVCCGRRRDPGQVVFNPNVAGMGTSGSEATDNMGFTAIPINQVSSLLAASGVVQAQPEASAAKKSDAGT